MGHLQWRTTRAPPTVGCQWRASRWRGSIRKKSVTRHFASTRGPKKSVCACSAATCHVVAWKHFDAQLANILFIPISELTLCTSSPRNSPCNVEVSIHVCTKPSFTGLREHTLMLAKQSHTEFLSPCGPVTATRSNGIKEHKRMI